MISITINVLKESRYTIILYMWPKFQILLSQNGNKHKRSHLRFNWVGNAIIQPFLFVFWSDVAILIASTADIFLPLSTVVTVTFLKESLLLSKATLSRPGGKKRTFTILQHFQLWHKKQMIVAALTVVEVQHFSPADDWDLSPAGTSVTFSSLVLLKASWLWFG